MSIDLSSCFSVGDVTKCNCGCPWHGKMMYASRLDQYTYSYWLVYNIYNSNSKNIRKIIRIGDIEASRNFRKV